MEKQEKPTHASKNKKQVKKVVAEGEGFGRWGSSHRTLGYSSVPPNYHSVDSCIQIYCKLQDENSEHFELRDSENTGEGVRSGECPPVFFICNSAKKIYFRKILFSVDAFACKNVVIWLIYNFHNVLSFKFKCITKLPVTSNGETKQFIKSVSQQNEDVSKTYKVHTCIRK